MAGPAARFRVPVVLLVAAFIARHLSPAWLVYGQLATQKGSRERWRPAVKARYPLPGWLVDGQLATLKGRREGWKLALKAAGEANALQEKARMEARHLLRARLVYGQGVTVKPAGRRDTRRPSMKAVAEPGAVQEKARHLSPAWLVYGQPATQKGGHFLPAKKSRESHEGRRDSWRPSMKAAEPKQEKPRTEAKHLSTGGWLVDGQSAAEKPAGRREGWRPALKAAAEPNALQEKARTDAVLFGDKMEVKLPDEMALTFRARARRRADWARKRLRLDLEETLEEIPESFARETDPASDAEREAQRIRDRVEAKRAKEREEAELKAATQQERQERRREQKRLAVERARTDKERRRAERMAESHGVQLPSLEEAHRMSVLQLRDALWNAGYQARGLPSPADAKQMAPEELKVRLQEAKVRFLTQLRYILRKARDR